MLEWFGRRMRYAQEVKRDERGFTLIELLVVVIIIGILAAIAIPTFLAQRDNAQSSAAKANVRTAATAEQAAYTETGAYVGVAALGPYGFNVANVEPVVSGGGTAGTYCVAATGGGETWSMDESMGAPDDVAC